MVEPGDHCLRNLEGVLSAAEGVGDLIVAAGSVTKSEGVFLKKFCPASMSCTELFLGVEEPERLVVAVEGEVPM